MVTARLWLNDGSCIRLRPSWRNHVWSYDFVQDRTDDGKPFRMLAVIDEHSRECLAIVVARRLRSDDVMACLSNLFVQRGGPDRIRSDNGPEFSRRPLAQSAERQAVRHLARAKTVRGAQSAERQAALRRTWLAIHGYCESFNGKLRDELLAREIFYTLEEGKILIERWRCHYNTSRPNSALDSLFLWHNDPIGQCADTVHSY